MAGAIRLVSIERGHDPAKFAAMPFGGGGALHAGALIGEVGLGSALIPRYPGITSALGCVVADMRHDKVQTVNELLGELDAAELGARMTADAEIMDGVLKGSDIAFAGIDHQFELDMLYLGQTHTVAVPLEINRNGLDRETIKSAFEGAYRIAYGRLLEGIPMRVMNYRIAVIGRRPGLDMTLFSRPTASRQKNAAPKPAPSMPMGRTGQRRSMTGSNSKPARCLRALPCWSRPIPRSSSIPGLRQRWINSAI